MVECVQCGKASHNSDNCWQPGEVCVCGFIFCCSVSCAEKWIEANLNEETRRTSDPEWVMWVCPPENRGSAP